MTKGLIWAIWANFNVLGIFETQDFWQSSFFWKFLPHISSPKTLNQPISTFWWPKLTWQLFLLVSPVAYFDYYLLRFTISSAHTGWFKIELECCSRVQSKAVTQVVNYLWETFVCLVCHLNDNDYYNTTYHPSSKSA